MRETEHSADAGAALSIRRADAAHNDALAETVLGLCKTEVVRPRVPWRPSDEMEFATLE